MHSCYTPTILYGFYDLCEEAGLSKEFLSEVYPSICRYPSDIIRNYGTDFVIGIDASISEEGIAHYDSEDAYKQLIKLKDKYDEYHKTAVQLKYISVIYGDYEEQNLYDYIYTLE
jgi:hypothetical protein